MRLNVIDLFAGPGGLGEGFFSFKADGENFFPYKAICSVEKDVYAHATLRLRAFHRKLIQSGRNLPDNYYKYAQGLSPNPYDENSFALWKEACAETMLLTLGENEGKDLDLFNDIKNQLSFTSKESRTILIGGPPCQAYSLVGRARNKGNKQYVPELDSRHFLYKEYLKIMNTISPDIFVMENVKGLLSSQVSGGAIFNQIIEDLINCGSGYTLFSLKTGERFLLGESNPKDLILKSEDYGVPQCRHRVIILGMKNTLAQRMALIPALQQSKKINVEQAIGDLPFCRSHFSIRSKFYTSNSIEDWKYNLITQITNLINKEKNIDPDIAEELQKQLDKLTSVIDLRVKPLLYKYKLKKTQYHEFICDSAGKEITSHEPRPHMDSDLVRYFYCSVFRKVKVRNATAIDFPLSLAPNHKSWNTGKFIDRFKVQGSDAPSSTITSHISKDGHYFIHPDPTQCRSLTVREAARLQSFPDSYAFMGKRTNQFHQVGNAVPPLLARQVASIVYEVLESLSNSSK